MLETRSEFAFLVQIRCEEGEGSSLHFVIGHCVYELSLLLMWNVGPTYGIVDAAHLAEAEPNYIDGSATESRGIIPIELHNPATPTFDCADGITQKSC